MIHHFPQSVDYRISGGNFLVGKIIVFPFGEWLRTDFRGCGGPVRMQKRELFSLGAIAQFFSADVYVVMKLLLTVGRDAC